MVSWAADGCHIPLIMREARIMLAGVSNWAPLLPPGHAMSVYLDMYEFNCFLY
jgi:hypothetical protein